MSGAQTSGFPNVLFNAPAAYQAAQTYQTNQLAQQKTQQDITDHDIAAVGQAAAPLLGMSEDDAAKAYPGWLQDAQSRGIAKYAPQTYPGHAAVQALVQRAMPILQQYQAGFITPPGLADALKAAQAPLPGYGASAAAAPSGGTSATSGTIEPDALNRAQAVRDGLIKRGLDADTATAFAANALHESSANPNTGAGDAGASHGLFQWRDDRYNRFGSTFGRPLDNAPLDQQLDYVVSELGSTEGAARDRIAAAQGPAAKAAAVSQFYLRPKDVQPEMARRSATATQLATQWGGAGTSTAAPVITGDSLASSGGLGGSGVVGASPKAVLASVQADSRAGKYSGQPVVLSTGASNDPTDLGSVEQQIREAQGGNAGRITVLGVGPAVEAKAPGTNTKLAALSKAYGADFVPLPADQMSPDGVHPTAQGYTTLKAAIAPPPRAPGGVAARVGGTDVAGPGATPSGPPAATSAPGAAPILPSAPQNALAPPPVAAQAAAPPGGTGVNSPQFQAALELNRRAQALELAAPASPQAKAMAASLRAQAALYMQADAVSVDANTGIQTKQITGERLNAAAPNAHYVWNDQQGAYVDTTGTHPPVTPPSPRLTQTKGGDILQSKPGGGATVVYSTSPQDVATQAAAQAQGTGVGGDVAKQMPALVAQGRNATQAIGNIDYGMNQLREAAKSGIPTGYFSQWLATGAAAAKSLGIDLSALGVDPKAVGNIQSAQKTLGVVAGAILQQAIGKDSQITDAKIEHFIHTQPGIETDPQAVERVLNWARSQFVYESEQSRAAVAEAANSPTGTLPLNWQARYFRDKGFAPIYDPGTGEMQQPEGRAPSREPPPPAVSPTTAPVNPSARTAGQTYQTPKGLMKWTGTGWVNP